MCFMVRFTELDVITTKMEKEIKEFIDSVGASEPNSKEENYDIFRKLFKRSNYFRLKGKLLIVKISRSKVSVK